MSAMFRGELGFLSNFHEEPFFMPMISRTVASGEHGFNALKATCPEDMDYVLSAATPREAKQRGRKISLVAGWDEFGRNAAMTEVIRGKFSNNNLGVKLVNTGDLKLVETNTWHDNYWGDCVCDKCSTVLGRNELGKALMGFRSLLQLQQAVITSESTRLNHFRKKARKLDTRSKELNNE